MLRIQKLVLHKFPHVAPGTVLEFGRGLNVLLGKNGTGKTTLLKLLTRVAALDFEGLEEEGDYKLECHVDYGSVTLELHVESRLDEVVFRRDEQFFRTARGWRYEGWVRESSNEIIVQFSHGSTQEGTTKPRVAVHPEQRLPDLTAAFATDLWFYFYSAAPPPGARSIIKAKLAQADDALYTIYRAAKISHVGRFDEALIAYDSIGGRMPPTDTRTPEPSQFVARGPANSGFTTSTFLPSDFPQSPMVGSFDQPAAALSTNLSDIPSLASFVTTAGLHAATIEVDKPEESGHDQMRRRTYTNFRLLVNLDKETAIYSNSLSFGQKRLFAFYWYLACIPEGVVLADELVNGFHHDWIAACLDQIGDRQAILASQNPLLLDFLTFDDAEQVRRSFVLCNLEDKEGGGRQWNWQNMTSDRAEEFFRAYEVGLQHVSEILRVGGWW